MKKKQIIWIAVSLIVVLVLGYGGHWGYNKYKINQRKSEIAVKIADYKAAAEANPSDVKKVMQYGIALHNYDNPERIEEALVVFKKVMEMDPANTTAVGYYGSTLTKKANYLEKIADKVEVLQEGLDIMDKNISDHPDDFAARMVRAENNYYLPSMFGRIATSVKDFEYLLEMTKSGNYISMIPYLKLRLGQSYIKAEKPEEAKKILQELVDEYPEDKNAKQAKEVISGLN